MAVVRIFLTLVLACVFVAMYGDAAAVLRWYCDAVAMLRWYCDAVAMRLRQKPYACECAGKILVIMPPKQIRK